MVFSGFPLWLHHCINTTPRHLEFWKIHRVKNLHDGLVFGTDGHEVIFLSSLCADSWDRVQNPCSSEFKALRGGVDPKEMDVEWMMMFDEPIWLVGCHHLIVPPQKREMFKHDCNMTVFLTAKKHFLKKNFSQTYTLAVAFFCLFCHN